MDGLYKKILQFVKDMSADKKKKRNGKQIAT